MDHGGSDCDTLDGQTAKQGERPLFGSPERALELYSERLPHYRSADLTIRPEPGEDAEALAGRLALALEAHS